MVTLHGAGGITWNPGWIAWWEGDNAPLKDDLESCYQKCWHFFSFFFFYISTSGAWGIFRDFFCSILFRLHRRLGPKRYFYVISCIQKIEISFQFKKNGLDLSGIYETPWRANALRPLWKYWYLIFNWKVCITHFYFIIVGCDSSQQRERPPMIFARTIMTHPATYTLLLARLLIILLHFPQI